MRLDVEAQGLPKCGELRVLPSMPRGRTEASQEAENCGNSHGSPRAVLAREGWKGGTSKRFEALVSAMMATSAQLWLNVYQLVM
mmetsp:Transcript_59474/g.123112  ORF Transcript_59474/g.123112 Transcript_59474/m.123112 type:complete len:84 (+) Transcript_59474:652-903(+)